jgi:hypothetical protein
MNTHIETDKLEKFILSPEDFNTEERGKIASHIDGCAYCKEYSEKLTAFYDSVSKELQNEPTEKDKAFAEKLLVPKGWIPTRNWLALPEKKLALQERVDNALSTFVEIIEPYHRPLAKRFVHYIKAHPIRVASEFSLAAGLVFATLLIRPMFKDTNPSYARAKDEFLVVYNKDGEELWKKHIGMGYDLEKYFNANVVAKVPDRYLTTIDVDHDGRKEIIAIFGWRNMIEWRNSVVCYNVDGSERWTYKLHRNMTFGTESFSDGYGIYSMIAGDFDRDGRVELIAVAIHEMYYPSAIISLDASNGVLLSEYWHSGHFGEFDHHDIEGNGIDDLLFVGQHNGYNQACFVVLDSRNVVGHSPAPPSYSPLGITPGNEKYYLLFPRADISRFSTFRRNNGRSLFFTADSLVKVTVEEQIDNQWGVGLLYFFNRSMECVRVDGSDQFVAFHKKMEAEKKLTKKLDAQYYEDLRRQVQYWDGDKFVNTATMNKKYVEMAKRLP